MNTCTVSPNCLSSRQPNKTILGSASSWEAGSWPDLTFHSPPKEKEESGHNTTRENQKLLLTVEEAATMLSLGRTFVYELVMRGDLASIKIGSRRRIPVAALEAFVTQRMAEQGERKGGS